MLAPFDVTYALERLHHMVPLDVVYALERLHHMESLATGWGFRLEVKGFWPQPEG